MDRHEWLPRRFLGPSEVKAEAEIIPNPIPGILSSDRVERRLGGLRETRGETVSQIYIWVKTLESQRWWARAEVRATQDTEAARSLEPRTLRLTWATQWDLYGGPSKTIKIQGVGLGAEGQWLSTLEYLLLLRIRVRFQAQPSGPLALQRESQCPSLVREFTHMHTHMHTPAGVYIYTHP